MNWRPRSGQWIGFYLKGDPYNEKLHFLASHGAALTRSGKLLGIYNRASRHSDVVLIPPDGPEQVQGGWLPERVTLVDKVSGENLPVILGNQVFAGSYLVRDYIDDLEPVLDRADLPAARYVAPGFQFRP